jgi:hypothetical protein
MAKELSWEDAIQRVMGEAGTTLRAPEISERILAQGLREKVGATPASTVAAIISISLREDTSPFLKVGRGQFALKNTITSNVENNANPVSTEGEENETGALQAFGMFWQREAVSWVGKPKILGRQGPGASEVNFSEQIGVYLLHDRERVIYVGRATDSLFVRLKAHTIDRLGGRWDRFSWFGLRSVTTEGNLSDPSINWNYTVVIETLEALLIESLEPPLNRRRGDNFSGVEFIQASDPEIEGRKKKKLMADIMKSAGLDT